MIFSLIGPRGSGKTTIAARLASLTGWPLRATDAAVAEAAGMTIPEIVAARGWPGFREWESRALQSVIEQAEILVSPGQGLFLDTGGGIVLETQNRELLRQAGLVIYLHAPAEILVARIAAAPRPPLTGNDDPLAEMRQILAERESLYRSLAQIDVNTHEMGIEATVTILAQWVMARCGVCAF